MNRINKSNRMVQNYYLFTTLVISILLFSCGEESKYPEPMTPEEALNSFELDEKFEIQLFASEPHVLDPVEMIFDEDGNIYVVEMPDYPFQPEGSEGRGRIKVLHDTDGDGQIDDFTIFADGIKDATSLQPWKDGLLVTAAPYIYYMKDTDGDFIADEKEVLFSGFFRDNQEAQITNLRFNIDNWIYANNHGHDGEVESKLDPDADPLSVGGADFRFRLDNNKFERETSPGQFGQALNKWGHRFVTQNTIHIQQMVIPYRYLHRQEFMPSTKGILNISDHDLRMYQLTEAPYWRIERSNRRQKKYDEQGLNRTEYIDNHFTGASGGTHYGGDLFPEEYRGNIFTGEVMGGLVHRDVLSMPDDQPFYTAQRAASEQTKEFLASTDMWFRPDHFTVGPDGALYVIDMYRQHIETPLSIPEDLKEEMDFMRGEDMGRIYRIVPKGSSPSVVPAEVKGEKSLQKYVEWLAKPNQWYRLHAQRKLIEANDESVISPVRSLFESNSDAVVRLHAFYVLEGLGALDKTIVKKALSDSHPGIKEYALIEAEKYPELLPQVLALKDDPSARIVLQVALSLGEFSSKNVIPALGDILKNHYDDHWIRLGVLSSEAGSSLNLVQVLSKDGFFKNSDDNKNELVSQLGYIIAARGAEGETAKLLDISSGFPEELKSSISKGILSGAKRAKIELKDAVKTKLESFSSN
ncbi:PVC-type heme-binding CxxCH protein [Membranihabitans maritimus]|uniref:PVC-type heme-binding CxxCH protein n=1 Tax=Membranihabitans maritimus TaxID=2904244 RepID=UPI001F1F8799|nr:PVC-type heme-binding CxxCH protein [Membranihabitans maritimus]